jgi:plasmid stabilization system protein ParE
VKIEISPRALREIERKAASWAEHSTISPGLLFDELEAAGQRLLRNPKAGTRWVSPQGRVLLRLYLERTQNHLYYTHEPELELIRMPVGCTSGPRTEAVGRSRASFFLFSR